MLLSSYNNFSKLKIYDIQNYINFKPLKKDFNKLINKKPYVLHICYTEGKYMKVNNEKKIEPIITNKNERVLCELLNVFTDLAEIPEDKVIQLQMQRVIGPTKVQEWYSENGKTVGIIIADEKNTTGGVHEFKQGEGAFLRKKLMQGNLVIFDDTSLKYRVTPLFSFDKDIMGYKDIISLIC